MRSFVFRWLGVPEHEPPEFYRDLLIAAPTSVAALVLVAQVADQHWWSWRSGAAIAVVALGVGFARDKIAVIYMAAGFMLVRLVFALFLLWRHVA